MIILPANTLSGGYEVANSCRWTSGDSPYMHKTPGSAGNLDLWTLSIWFKRGTLTNSDANEFIYVQSDSNNFDRIRISDDNLLQWKGLRGGSTSFELKPTMVFRDPTAWYHIVFQWDSADSTADDRMKIFVNGTQVTSFGTRSNPSSGLDSLIGDAEQTYVGGHNTGTNWEGYFAEYVYINASQLPPTSFGEFDEDSPTIWKPKDVSGLTFGTNGFYLDFEDSSNLGNDANGGTDLTEVNLAATDQATDTPTNSFATWNPLIGYDLPNGGFSEGNLIATQGGNTTWTGAISNFGVASGKWYMEVKWTGQYAVFGFIPESQIHNLNGIGQEGTTSYGLYYNGDLFVYENGSDAAESSFSNAISSGDVVQMALDKDNNRMYWGINGTWQNSADPAAGSGYKELEYLTDEFWFFVVNQRKDSGNGTMAANFGGCPAFTISSGNADANGYGNFEYSVPSGYLALCTKNLGSDGG